LPITTLFPYTTLFRSFSPCRILNNFSPQPFVRLADTDLRRRTPMKNRVVAGVAAAVIVAVSGFRVAAQALPEARDGQAAPDFMRSEEHTSELQSQSNL